MAEQKQDARELLRGIHAAIIKAGGDRRYTVGRCTDELVGMRPLPQKTAPPRRPPEISASTYRNILRGTP